VPVSERSTAPLLERASLPLGAAELGLRRAVALRERRSPSGTALYLSLYDEEIEERAATFWSVWDRGMRHEAWPHLELTDAVLFVTPDEEILVGRGAACTFPLYWSTHGRRVRISTWLPVLDGEPFSRSGLVACAAAACLHSSYEPNAFAETPLAHWRRARRGAVLRIRQGHVHEEHLIRLSRDEQMLSREAIIRRVRVAFDAYAHSQRRVASSLLELSGGFDSTLAAAIPSRAGIRGVSVTFPYYEFRFERSVQQATADFLGIPRVELDGTELLPYTPSEASPRFDEPAVFVTGVRHAEKVARLAASIGAQRIYTGHGGDQCFSTDLLAREELVAQQPTRGPFSSRAWPAISRAIHEIRRSGFMERSLGTFVYDARSDVWVKETFGPTMRTPFADLAVFRSALAWSHWCKARGVRPNKTILADAARDLLPHAILTRKGKVAYDGIWMRAYHQQADPIAALFENVSDVFAHVGVSTAWLQRRVLDLGAWREKSDREVLGLYAIAVWLAAWGLLRAADVEWTD
jgi:asparagine synthetase B (glutamine-hydrolysing)